MSIQELSQEIAQLEYRIQSFQDEITAMEEELDKLLNLQTIERIASFAALHDIDIHYEKIIHCTQEMQDYAYLGSPKAINRDWGSGVDAKVINVTSNAVCLETAIHHCCFPIEMVRRALR